jgi:DNA-binding response OmpR family regulator
MAKKVLVIEDRRENIVFIANNILKPEGWEVITARDGELGLQKAIEDKPDLIITDLKLPKMHGLDVLEALNKQGYRIPTIVMTFHGSEETAIRAFRLGAADYLIKPFDVQDIMAAIDRALRSGPASHVPPASVDAAVAEKLASQEREIQRLRSLLQQQMRTLQEREQSAQPAQAGPADITRWQALLREKEVALVNLKKQTLAQHQAMSKQINYLQAQLAEKEAIVANLQRQILQAGSGGDVRPEESSLSAQLAEKERALAQADKLAKTLTQTITAQQQTIEKQREEAERLARELHLLATGIQMLGQGLSDQARDISSALPGGD